MRILVLNSRHDPDHWIDEQLERLRASLEGHTVVASRDDFKANIANLGNYESWVNDVVHGVDYGSFQPRYDAFIVYGDSLGKANAAIVREALRAQKPVLYMQRDGAEQVIGVREIDPKNYTSGWQVVVAL